MGAVVVYVHGLWLPGQESFLLRRRVARALDAESRMFGYPSVSATLADNAAALGRFLREIRGETLHLIAHSMGGLLILKLFDLGLGRDLPPGRIVLTGSPVRGCRSAERLARLPLGRAMLGRSATEGLLARGEPRWQGARDLGVIAGDLGLGLGRLLGRFTAPNDGTVLVEETDLPGATERLILPVSHSGMVFSAEVARQAAAYLQRGRFDAKG